MPQCGTEALFSNDFIDFYMQIMSQHSIKMFHYVTQGITKKMVIIIITNKENLVILLISGWEFNQIWILTKYG